MKWAHTIKNKILASGALLFLCLLVLYSNYIDRTHTENVKKSISTLYEDRLIAESYILKMTSSLYQIKEVIKTEESRANKDQSINELLSIIKKESKAYHKTKFTKLETIKADELLAVLRELAPEKVKMNQLNLENTNKALVLLNELSAIQLTESKEIMNLSERLYQSGKTSSQFVFALIILILIFLQALVFTSGSLLPKKKPDFPRMN